MARWQINFPGSGFVACITLAVRKLDLGLRNLASKIVEDTNEVAVEVGGGELTQLPGFVLRLGGWRRLTAQQNPLSSDFHVRPRKTGKRQRKLVNVFFSDDGV